MNTPQIILLIIVAVELLLQARFHGTLRQNPRYDFWTSFLGWCIIMALLLTGGFFK